jgi:anti-sigma regulatory factor (Ser/Thr protein kinase)
LSHEAVILIVGFGGPGRNGFVRRLRENHDVHVVEVPDGAAALQSIVNEPPDLVLTELELPDMNASRLLRRVRCQFPFLPHMVVAPDDNRETTSAAITSGARWCLSESDPEGILDVVGRFVRTAECCRQWDQLERSCVRSELEFVIGNDDIQVSSLVRFLQRNAARVRRLEDESLFELGVALSESLRNAVEHGNLEVHSETPIIWREGRIRDIDWEEITRERRLLVHERLRTEPYRSRHVTVVAQETATEGRYRIRDEGRGFDVASFRYDPTRGENIAIPWGRGLYLVRQFMHEVSWNRAGNEITLVHRRRGHLRVGKPKAKTHAISNSEE